MMTSRFFSRCLFLLLAGLLLTWNVTPTFATNSVVSNCGDNGGPNQLRATMASVLSSGGGTITFSCGPTITLDPALGRLPVVSGSKSLTIDGGNAITISGANGTQIFADDINSTLTLKDIILTKGGDTTHAGGAIYSLGTLNLNHVTITFSTGLGNGGAFYSGGTLNVTNSEFANNSAPLGGAMAVAGGGGSITNSSIHDNQALGSSSGGGGVYLYGGASALTITTSQLYNNSSDQGGGGLNVSGTFTLTNSQIHDNAAKSNAGGGIFASNTANVKIDNSQLYANHAYHQPSLSDGQGGAIYNQGVLNVTQSTLNSNSADGYGGGAFNFGTGTFINVTLSGNKSILGSDGGAILNQLGTMNLTNVTINNNSGNSISNSNLASSHLNLKNVIVANTVSGNNCNFPKVPDSSSFNLSSDNSCNFGNGRNNVNVMLGPLTDNGGPTLTHMLFGNSSNNPAIDNGTGIGCPTIDQRGKPRPAGLACDVGAVERQTFDAPFLFLPLVVR